MRIVQRLIVLPVILSNILVGLAFDKSEDHNAPLQAGYAVITPTSSNTDGLVAFETFGELKGNTATQAGVLPADMTKAATLFVSTNGRLLRNLGVAIANPDPANGATLTLTLFSANGNVFSTPKELLIPAKTQVSQFVTQLFSEIPQDFTGTLSIVSKDNPVAVVGLRFRGENFSTIPITSLSAPIQIPTIDVPGAKAGGAGAVILPQFAIGGGWASQIIVGNSSDKPLTVRVDLFKQDGTPLTADLNGTSASSFASILVPAKGVIVLSQRNQSGDDDF